MSEQVAASNGIVTFDDEFGDGWSNVLMFEDAGKTVFMGLKSIPSETKSDEKIVRIGFQFEAAKFPEDPKSFATLVTRHVDDNGWNENYQLNRIHLDEFESRWIAGKTLVSYQEGLELYAVKHEGARHPLQPLFDPKIVNNDTYFSSEVMLRNGIRRNDDGSLSFDTDREVLAGEILDGYPFLGQHHPSKVVSAIERIKEGHSPTCAIAEETKLSEDLVEAMSAARLRQLGFTDRSDKNTKLLITALPHIEDGRRPATAEDARAVVAITRFAANVVDQGLRSDAVPAFLRESSQDWQKGFDRVKSAGKFTLGEAVWKAAKEAGLESKGPVALRREMSLFPYMSLREASQLCAKRNKSTMDDDYVKGALPDVFPRPATFDGGSVREIKNMSHFDTIDFEMGASQERTYRKSLQVEMLKGETLAFAVYDDRDRSVGALVTNIASGERALLNVASHDEPSRSALSHGADFVTSELIPSKKAELGVRSAVIQDGGVKFSYGQLSRSFEARNTKHRADAVCKWSENLPFLPASMRAVGVEAFSIHLSNQVKLAKQKLQVAEGDESPSSREKPSTKKQSQDVL